MSNDRIQAADLENKLPKPEVKIIVDGKEVVKPGMRTFYTSNEEGGGIIRSGDQSNSGVISYSVCSCNTVPVCSCNSYVKPRCSCNSNRSGGGSRTVCSCVPVH